MTDIPFEQPEPPGPEGLAEAWQQVRPSLGRLAASLGCSPQEIEDVLQDAYVAAHENSKLVGDRAGMRRWLFRVVANGCHDVHRRRSRWRTWIDWVKTS